MTGSLFDIARALRAGDLTATGLLEEALRRHREHEPPLGAYMLVDEEGARAAAELADERLASSGPDSTPGPLCGIPVSVKDLYGVRGLPTFAGTPRALPEAWSREGWLVARLREQGALFVGKTHTVEMAYAGIGINPHWGTPRNPWDDDIHRIPGGSSSGAGVSLVEGSALVALGSDTGGSIRVPASFTGTVGHKTTKGRWPTDGVVPLSHSLDTVGALTRSVDDSLYFFASVDPSWGDPDAFRHHIERWTEASSPLRIGVPRGRLWDECQGDIRRVLEDALDRLPGRGWHRVGVDGSLLERAADLYLTGAIAGPECKDFMAREIPEWVELLHPIVADRLATAPDVSSDEYGEAQRRRREMVREASTLFGEVDVLALPGHLVTPPPMALLEDPERYRAVNATVLRPTCCVSLLGLCAVTLPVGFDDSGLPVGLQLVAPGGEDEVVLGAAMALERAL